MPRRLGIILLVLLGTLVIGASPALAAPPGIPSAATARTELAALTVATAGSGTTYDRALFPHWHTVSGACNTTCTARVDMRDVPPGKP